MSHLVMVGVFGLVVDFFWGHPQPPCHKSNTQRLGGWGRVLRGWPPPACPPCKPLRLAAKPLRPLTPHVATAQKTSPAAFVVRFFLYLCGRKEVFCLWVQKRKPSRLSKPASWHNGFKFISKSRYLAKWFGQRHGHPKTDFGDICFIGLKSCFPVIDWRGFFYGLGLVDLGLVGLGLFGAI